LEVLKGRKKILAGFHHIHDLDDRYARLIPSNQQSGESIYKMLKQKGAPEVCYIMSDDSAIDGTEMLLHEAIFKVEGSNSAHWFHASPASWHISKQKT
jgi:hypothetical protein